MRDGACPTRTRAEADKRIIEERLRFEKSETIKRGLKIAIAHFERVLAEHRECNCKEAA